ncbi:hypothetical protein GCM10017567_73780 [Amycolatopsis bullii]|uniref:Uncharacterized protein n=1 Tax=Amycolatopsis bullii TaxID=941987 RepID=A0ABQ3KPY4_9PSEU|nr:hypothetical protein GCM10017567_73780 [Amycolatopsis bullii]
MDPRAVLGRLQDRKGSSSKAYRSTRVWPVICDFPEPVRVVTIESHLRRLTPQEAYDWGLWDGCRDPSSIARHCARAWGREAGDFVAHDHLLVRHSDGTFIYLNAQADGQ